MPESPSSEVNVTAPSVHDPSIVYHSHSFNVPHLNTWIDELVRLTERSHAVGDTPTTDNLVQALQRYDAAFRELLRQTSLFSEPVTKLLAKVWGGVLRLLDYMIKSYHRYVKHTSGLQRQAQLLVSEKQNQSVASKVREDEFELERTFLKARIRNLEAEIEAMKATKRGMDRENSILRTVLDTYIRSKEMNDPLWDILNDRADEKNPHSGRDLPSRDSASTREVGGYNHRDESDANGSGPLSSHFRRKDSIDSGREQLRIINRLDVEMNGLLTSVLKEEDRQRLLVDDLVGLLEANQDIFGPGGRVEGKWKTGSDSFVLRVDKGTQVDLKDEFGVVTDLIETPKDAIDIPPPFSANSKRIRGDSVPYLFRNIMSSFPHVLRIPTAAWVCQVILSIYLDKINTNDHMQVNTPKMNLPQYIHAYFLKFLGLASVVDAQVAQFLQACEVYMPRFRRIALFSSQIGLHDKEAASSLDIRDTEFVLSVIRHLIKLGELVPEKASKKKLTTNAVVIKPDISKSAAVATVQALFEKWLPDGGHDYVLKVKALVPTTRGNKFIDLDEFIELLIEPWHTVRLMWEEHLRFVFHEHCTVHRVLSEAQFSNDSGLRDRDTIVSQLSKSSVNDCPRRPLRLFQRKEADKSSDDSAAAANKRPAAGKASNQAKEPICELMNRKTFINTLSILNTTMLYDDVSYAPSSHLPFLLRATLIPLSPPNTRSPCFTDELCVQRGGRVRA